MSIGSSVLKSFCTVLYWKENETSQTNSVFFALIINQRNLESNFRPSKCQDRRKILFGISLKFTYLPEEKYNIFSNQQKLTYFLLKSHCYLIPENYYQFHFWENILSIFVLSCRMKLISWMSKHILFSIFCWFQRNITTNGRKYGFFHLPN